jgi:MtN3 and saliva related transmembrane protein
VIATQVGLVAGAVTSCAVIPQVVKAYRSKHVRDISVWQPVILVFGMFLWLAYGLMIRDIPLIAANFFSIFCNSLLIAMKLFYREG